MHHQFTVREAKARLSEILDLAASGATVEITRQGSKAGRFKLVASENAYDLRQPGALKGKITIPDDFDAEDPSITDEFEKQTLSALFTGYPGLAVVAG